MDAQMKKGVLELCLLQCLSGEPKYGYDVIQTMRAYFPEVTESTFYAVLRRLHKEGAAETFQGGASNGPVRKYYRLTDQGRDIGSVSLPVAKNSNVGVCGVIAFQITT